MMPTRRVDIIGGGPAGAYTARLVARRHSDWHVRLFERLPPDDTFGFGVGLTHGLLRAVHAADPELHEVLMSAVYPFSSARFCLPQGSVDFGQFHNGAIRRSKLLRLLLQGAADAGVEVQVGRSVTVDELASDADLVVCADGLSSATRERYRAEFRPQSSTGRGVFIWCGAEVELDGTVFMPAETSDGTFVAHAYPYDEGMSTFVIETSQETLQRAGFASREWTNDSDSDDEALTYLSTAFAPLLRGGKFFGNRSRWTQFTTLRCASWHHDNVVLLGDAVATVHPSLGSGTKVALESAIALADALDEVGDQPLASALAVYERNRRPSVARLQESSQRSQLWWESFTSRLHLPGARLAVAYLSRAGVVSLSSLTTSAPDLAIKAAAEFAGVSENEVPSKDLTDWVLNRPVAWNGSGLSTRIMRGQAGPGQGSTALIEIESGDAWGPQGQNYLEKARAQMNAGVDIIQLVGGMNRSAVLDRLSVAERLRVELPVLIGVAVDEKQLSLGADGLVAGRIDLVWMPATS
jgi:anthraniloyl-CoA monooxygenase